MISYYDIKFMLTYKLMLQKCKLYIATDDFMPASVDTTQQGIVDVGEGNQVTVSLPHVEVNITKKIYFIVALSCFIFSNWVKINDKCSSYEVF